MDRRRLAVIHIIKKELGLSDGAYRDTLQTVAGVSSARDLDDAGFRRLMRHLVRSGRYIVQPGGLTLRQKLYLEQLAASSGWTPEHLRHFILKYYHVPDLTHLSKQQASHAIESLKHVRARRDPSGSSTGDYRG